MKRKTALNKLLYIYMRCKHDAPFCGTPFFDIFAWSLYFLIYNLQKENLILIQQANKNSFAEKQLF